MRNDLPFIIFWAVRSTEAVEAQSRQEALDTILRYASISVENAMQQPFQGKEESDEDA
jgi:hypothetical protein